MPAELRSRGYFYLPTAPSRKIAGELRAREDGVFVELDGTFQPPATLIGVRASYQLVHGVLADGKIVSLMHVYQTAAHIGRYLRESWRVIECLVGAGLPEDPTFDEMQFEFDHLPDWFVRSSIKVDLGDDSPGSTRIVSSPPDDLRAQLGDGTTIGIGIRGALEARPHLAQIGERIIGRAQCVRPLLARELAERYLVPLRDLITFATLVPAVVETVTVRSPLRGVAAPDGTVAKVWMPIFLPLLQPGSDLREVSPLGPGRTLFSLDDWPGSFEELMKAWWRLRHHQSSALNILLGLSYAPPRWSDSRTVAWAQAFEAYHRIGFCESPATTVAKERYERVLASCPRGDREWLQVRLDHADEPSLRKRIQEMSVRVRQIVDPLLAQHADLADRLSRARNVYSHFGAVGEASGGASGAELHILAEVARWVFLANVLLDLGFEERTAQALVQRNASFRHLIDNPPPLPLR